ncbi:putative protein kinase RLK-Pelle-RLCK-VIIa-2 family [Helianthus annuus]|nr:putative protein kinase RLK-Pelle-RLCK-VIIa-2 family [Helianthus annuus]
MVPIKSNQLSNQSPPLDLAAIKSQPFKLIFLTAMIAVQVSSNRFLYLHLFFPCSPQFKFLVEVYSLVSSPHSPLFLLLNSCNYNFIYHHLAFGLKKTQAPPETHRNSMYVLFPDPYIGYTKPVSNPSHLISPGICLSGFSEEKKSRIWAVLVVYFDGCGIHSSCSILISPKRECWCGFGTVHKGFIDDKLRPGVVEAQPVAVKLLDLDGGQGHNERLDEVTFLGQLRHPHLVKLIGYCCEDKNRLLVYEYMARGNLESQLFRRYSISLAWLTRIKIALGAAKGLAFLHGEEKPVIATSKLQIFYWDRIIRLNFRILG